MAYFTPNPWKGLGTPYPVNWAGRPQPPTRAPFGSLGAFYEPTGDWPPQISPGSPEEGLYDQLQPTSGIIETVTGNPLILVGAALAAYLLFFRKKGGSNLVGKSIRLKSIAAR